MSKPTLIFATFLAPVLYKTWLYITEYVERYVGIPTFLLPGEHLEDFAAGHIDAGFISGLSYVHFADEQYQGIRERYRGGQTNLLPLEPGEDVHDIHP